LVPESGSERVAEHLEFVDLRAVRRALNCSSRGATSDNAAAVARWMPDHGEPLIEIYRG
jgi:hypothetical protein